MAGTRTELNVRVVEVELFSHCFHVVGAHRDVWLCHGRGLELVVSR